MNNKLLFLCICLAFSIVLNFVTVISEFIKNVEQEKEIAALKQALEKQKADSEIEYDYAQYKYELYKELCTALDICEHLRYMATPHMDSRIYDMSYDHWLMANKDIKDAMEVCGLVEE
jgi:hypothetical protein